MEMKLEYILVDRKLAGLLAIHRNQIPYTREAKLVVARSFLLRLKAGASQGI